MSLFDRCAECRQCCKSIDSYLHIHVFAHEPGLKSRLAVSGLDTTKIVIAPGNMCSFLGPCGCTLGEIKPFHCRFYPLFLLPGDAIGIDTGCSCCAEYISQLGDPSSDASYHLKNSKKELAKLLESEKAALCDWSHYACDVDVLEDSKFQEGTIHEVT
jgi:Fe-S-cluster containining protein